MKINTKIYSLEDVVGDGKNIPAVMDDGELKIVSSGVYDNIEVHLKNIETSVVEVFPFEGTFRDLAQELYPKLRE